MFPIWDNMPGRLTRKTSEFLIHAPHSKAMIGRHHQLISTHAPRMGSDLSGRNVFYQPTISTHAPRMGSDLSVGESTRRSRTISTHAPRMGSDLGVLGVHRYYVGFQPTLPVWGAT